MRGVRLGHMYSPRVVASNLSTLHEDDSSDESDDDADPPTMRVYFQTTLGHRKPVDKGVCLSQHLRHASHTHHITQQGGEQGEAMDYTLHTRQEGRRAKRRGTRTLVIRHASQEGRRARRRPRRRSPTLSPTRPCRASQPVCACAMCVCVCAWIVWVCSRR